MFFCGVILKKELSGLLLTCRRVVKWDAQLESTLIHSRLLSGTRIKILHPKREVTRTSREAHPVCPFLFLSVGRVCAQRVARVFNYLPSHTPYRGPLGPPAILYKNNIAGPQGRRYCFPQTILISHPS